MAQDWPALAYEAWSETCDTLHAHTQVLGKLAVALAAPEPQLQHSALRLTARGWETGLLPAPDGSGAIVVALDLRAHQAVVEHSDGRDKRIALAPDRPVAEVTLAVLEAVTTLGGAVTIDPTPQEVSWSVALDEDREHARYDPAQVMAYFAAATRAALVLAAFRAPYRGRSTPVNAGGPETRATARRRSTPTPTQHPRSSRQPRSLRQLRAGTARSASSSWTGRRSERAPIRMWPGSSLPAPRSSTPAPCAIGTPCLPPAPTRLRHRSGEGPTGLRGPDRRAAAKCGARRPGAQPDARAHRHGCRRRGDPP